MDRVSLHRESCLFPSAHFHTKRLAGVICTVVIASMFRFHVAFGLGECQISGHGCQARVLWRSQINGASPRLRLKHLLNQCIAPPATTSWGIDIQTNLLSFRTWSLSVLSDRDYYSQALQS